jgi:hypothetical protein
VRKRVTAIAFLCSLTAHAAVDSGARISMPPNSQKTGRFSFVNHCPTNQTFRITAQPPADWLRFEPATVNARPNTSFDVRVTVKTSGRAKLGAFQSGIRVICAGCVASEPPCIEEAAEFPISLTVAEMKAPGDFEPIEVSAAPASATPTVAPKPAGLPAAPRRAIPRFFLLIGGAILAAGAVVLFLAVRELSSTARTERALQARRFAPESERHRVRR